MRNQDKLEKQYGDQVFQLRSNKFSKCLMNLESIFNFDDQFKKEKENITIYGEDYEPISFGRNKLLIWKGMYPTREA